MPPGGWGRRAAGKIDRKLEDDELFKEIGGQLDESNFDYSQWQRSKAKVPTTRRPPPPQKKDLINAFDRPMTGPSTWKTTPGTTETPREGSRNDPSRLSQPSTVSTGAGTHRRSGSVTSSCQHGTTKKKNVQDDIFERKKAEQIKILQLRIRARKQTIEEYRKREVQLLEENMKIRTQIEKEEGESHEAVKSLLRKYEKFRGGIASLNDKFGEELGDTKADIEITHKSILLDLQALQKQVDKLDGELAAQQGELHVLLNYKDKEYPVKALRISDLQKEIEEISLINLEEEEELQHVIDTELEKMYKVQETLQREVTQGSTQEAIDLMPVNLKDMALQNLVMAKELEFHTSELEELEETNRNLQAEVKRLAKDPKTDLRRQMFPELFPTREKCTPDMDVVLDIPTHEWLPI